MTFPPNIELLLQKENNLIDFSIIEMEEKNSEKLRLKDKFYQWELSSFMLNNIGELLFIWLIVFAVCLSVWAINYVMIKRKLIELDNKKTWINI